MEIRGRPSEWLVITADFSLMTCAASEVYYSTGADPTAAAETSILEFFLKPMKPGQKGKQTAEVEKSLFYCSSYHNAHVFFIKGLTVSAVMPQRNEWAYVETDRFRWDKRNWEREKRGFKQWTGRWSLPTWLIEVIFSVVPMAGRSFLREPPPHMFRMQMSV